MDIVPNDTERIGLSEASAHQEHEACIQVCMDCAKVCTDLVDHCLQVGGDLAQPCHVRQLLVCARLCETTAHVLLLHSAEDRLVCSTCAEICQHTAEDLEVYERDEKMRFATHLTRRCAESCAEVAKHPH
jgi:hypothetical protein